MFFYEKQVFNKAGGYDIFVLSPDIFFSYCKPCPRAIQYEFLLESFRVYLILLKKSWVNAICLLWQVKIKGKLRLPEFPEKQR